MQLGSIRINQLLRLHREGEGEGGGSEREKGRVEQKLGDSRKVGEGH